MLLRRGAHPVNLGVTTDGLVVDVNHYYFKVFKGGVFSNPVRIEDAQTLQLPADPLLSDGLEVPLRLHLLDCTGRLGFTVRTSLRHGTFTATTTHADTVDHETLLCLVPKPSSTVRAG